MPSSGKMKNCKILFCLHVMINIWYNVLVHVVTLSQYLFTIYSCAQMHTEMSNQNFGSNFGHEARQLNDEEINKLLSDTEVISNFKQQKLEKDAKKNWDLFYKRNLDKFFRDRNWTVREFRELVENDNLILDKTPNLLEIGCGVGNFIWPLIKAKIPYNYYACDFSPIALDILKKNELYDEKICHVFQADASQPNGIISQIEQNTRFSVISLIFVLSAIHPTKMKTVFENIFEILDHTGILIFRDYGLYDYAMLRFASGHKLDDNFYVRQDGTRAYYFSLEFIKNLLLETGFEIVSLQYVKRETVNLKEGLSVPRIFIQGKFKKK